MKKRTAVFGALVSLLPLGQQLIIGTGAALTSSAVILSIPEKVNSENIDYYFAESSIILPMLFNMN